MCMNLLKNQAFIKMHKKVIKKFQNFIKKMALLNQKFWKFYLEANYFKVYLKNQKIIV